MKDCKSRRSGMKYNGSLLLPAEADGKAEFRLEFDDTHDTKAERRRNGIYKR